MVINIIAKTLFFDVEKYKICCVPYERQIFFMKKGILNMKKTFKVSSIIAIAMGVFQSGVTGASAIDVPIITSWVSRTIQEVRNSIQSDSNVYVVQWGDTLNTISAATGISVEDLVKLNNIQDADLIIAGSTLYFDKANHTVTYVAPDSVPVTYSTETEEIVETTPEVQGVLETASESVTQEVFQPEVLTPMPEVAQIELVETAPVEIASVAETQPESVTPVQSEELITSAVVNESVEEVVNSVEPVQTPVPEEIQPSEQVAETPQGTPITVEATAYSYQEAGLSTHTADGTVLTVDSQVIAVDPSVIPLGTMVYIPGYGTYRAADTGGAIVGNKIDIHMNDVASALQFGRRTLTIYILN